MIIYGEVYHEDTFRKLGILDPEVESVVYNSIDVGLMRNTPTEFSIEPDRQMALVVT